MTLSFRNKYYLTETQENDQEWKYDAKFSFIQHIDVHLQIDAKTIR